MEGLAGSHFRDIGCHRGGGRHRESRLATPPRLMHVSLGCMQFAHPHRLSISLSRQLDVAFVQPVDVPPAFPSLTFTQIPPANARNGAANPSTRTSVSNVAIMGKRKKASGGPQGPKKVCDCARLASRDCEC